MKNEIRKKSVKIIDDDVDVPDLLNDNEVDEELVDEELLEFEALAAQQGKEIDVRDIKSTKDLQKYLGQIDVSQAKKYGIHEKYGEGDLITHEKFGLGVVCKILTPKKIEVFFEKGKKLMAMCYPLG